MMNSDKVEAGGVSVSDLPYLEHLRKDLELKSTLVDSEYSVKVAESAILLEEYSRTSKELDDVMDRIEYIHDEYDTKQYKDGFKDVDPIGFTSVIYNDEGEPSFIFKQFEPRDPIEADTSELGFTLDGDHHE